MEIKVLPQALANKIAAGEVVERPASVIKELVENALDAGAENITVEIRRGGMTFIRVTDDGHGMTPENARLAFLRHATSKIADESDLYGIKSFGFRGEALAAISSVSKVELITCPETAETAFFLKLEAGEIVEEDEVGAPHGTTIIIRDLFYNTPARLHFMKTDSTETAAIISTMERLAIGRSDVSMTLISNGRQVFKTYRRDDMSDAIYQIYGPTISTSMIPVDFSYKNKKVSGYICRSSIMRSNRNLQHIYVNSRFVKSKTAYGAIDDAYQTSRETGRHPVCFLKIDIEPDEVDVNVHPAKTEVKFRDERSVYVVIKYAIMDALSKDRPFGEHTELFIPNYAEKYKPNSLELKTQEEAKELLEEAFANKAKAVANAKTPEEATKVAEHFNAEIASQFGYCISERPAPAATPTFVSTATPSFLSSLDFEKDFETEQVENELKIQCSEMIAQSNHGLPADMRLLGEIFKVYIVIEYQDNLYLVDKHAAHEKMIYNRLVEESKGRANIPVQTLLQPINVVLSASDIDLALQNITSFVAAGFDFYESGADCISLTAVPEILPSDSFIQAFTEAVESIRKNKTISFSERQNQILKTIACRSAIKGGKDCKVEELAPLISELLISSDVSYCPHGRPIVRCLSHKDIDKMFKRIK